MAEDEALAANLAREWGAITAADVPGEALEAARHCALDWLACAVAGSPEPLATILVEQLVHHEGPGPCTVIGRGATAAARTAALVNGAFGHALDFDDTHLLLSGHPTGARAAGRPGRGRGARCATVRSQV